MFKTKKRSLFFTVSAFFIIIVISCSKKNHYISNHKSPLLTTSAIIEVYDQDVFQGIVLIERNKTPFGFSIPRGKVEYGENLENAIQRTVFENVNLELEDIRQFHVYSNPVRDIRHHSVEVTHIAKSQNIPQTCSENKPEVFIIKIEDIPWETLTFDHALILRDYLEYRKTQNLSILYNN